MTTSYTLTKWDNETSMSSLSQLTHMAEKGLNNDWTVGEDNVRDVDVLDTQNMDGLNPGRVDAYTIFGLSNQTEVAYSQESVSTVPLISSFEDAAYSLAIHPTTSSDTRPNDVSDVSNALGTTLPATEARMFIPITSSALHSPTARKNASDSPLSAKLLEAISVMPARVPSVIVPTSPSPFSQPSSSRRLRVQSEEESDSMSMYVNDVHAEDEVEDVNVVESLLNDFSPSKSEAYSSGHPGSLQSHSSHNAVSNVSATSPRHQHASLFTPPPSDEQEILPSSVRTGRDNCPSADRLFTPELFAKSQGKGKEKADEVSRVPKRRTVMAYVQVPPLKASRSDYVKYGISGSFFASETMKKRKAMFGPPPSEAGPSRSISVSATRPPFSSAAKEGPSRSSNSITSKSRHNYDRGLTLGDALQASFNHNERVGTLDLGSMIASGSRKTGKGKERESEWDAERRDRRKAVPLPSRIRASNAFHPARHRPPISVGSTSTTSGSVAVTGRGNVKKRPLKHHYVDSDSDFEMSTKSKVKKKPKVDIDLTLSASDEESQGELTTRKRTVAQRHRKEIEDDNDESDEVQIVEFVTTKPSSGPKRVLPSMRPPVSSASTRPPHSPPIRSPSSIFSLSPLASATSTHGLSSAPKDKGKAVNSTAAPPPKPRSTYTHITSSNSHSESRIQMPAQQNDNRFSSFPRIRSVLHKENEAEIPINLNPIARPKFRKAGAVYDHDKGLVRLILGDLVPVGRDLMGHNLKGLRAEVGQRTEAGAFSYGLPMRVFERSAEQRKRRSGSGMVLAPWACPPPNPVPLFKSSSGSVEGREVEDSVVGGSVFTQVDSPFSSSTTFEAPTDKTHETKKGKESHKVESLFSEGEGNEDEGERSDVESGLEYVTGPESDDDLVLTSFLVNREWPSAPSVTSQASHPTSPPTSTVSQDVQTWPPLDIPVKKIDLAARFRKNANRNGSKVKRFASTPSSTRAKPHPHLSVPLTNELPSSISMSVSAGPAFMQRQLANVDEHVTSTPPMPFAKTSGKHRAVGPPSHDHFGEATLSTFTSPPPPPYAPVLQHAFSALSTAIAGTSINGASINVNVNATINHHHHHLRNDSQNYLSPLKDTAQYHMLRDPHADLNIFLASPIRLSNSSAGADPDMIPGADLDLGVRDSGSGGLYSKAYHQNLQLRDDAVLFGAPQPDHLYSPPDILRAKTRPGEEVEGLDENTFDHFDLNSARSHPEDPWETLTDGDGQYTYLTVNPALIGGDGVDVLSGKSMFSEEEKEIEAVISRVQVDSVADENIQEASPALPSLSPSSGPSRSLSASATRPRHTSRVETQRPPSSASDLSVVVPNDDEEDDDMSLGLEMEQALRTSRKRQRESSADSLFSNRVSAGETLPMAQDKAKKRKSTTSSSAFDDVPLTNLWRSRRKRVPRRLDDMIPTSALDLGERGKSDSEYAPSILSAPSGGQEDEGGNVAQSDSERSGSDSEDRVVVVKKKLAPLPPSGPSEPFKAPRGEAWPMTSSETYCHQCRTKSKKVKMPCTCGRMYCIRCFTIRYPGKVFDSVLKKRSCPACLQYCNCTACCKKRGEIYVPTAKRPPGQRIALEGKTNLPSVPTSVPALSGPLPETAKYWGSIYSLTTGERLTSSFVTPDIGTDEVSGAPNVVYAPASSAVAAPPARLPKSKPMVKDRIFVGGVQRCWGLGRHPKLRDVEPVKPSFATRGKRDNVRLSKRRFYVGNPAFLRYHLPEQEDLYDDLLEGLSPLTTLGNSSDEELDGAGSEAGMA